MAIGFILMVSMISAGLVGLATSGLNNRNTLQLVRDRQYAADAAIEDAISWVRLQAGPATVDCSSSGSRADATLNAVTIRVDWQNTCPSPIPKDSAGTSYPQRNVTFSAFCSVTKPDAKCNFTDAIIVAQVNFEPASGPVTKTYVQSWSINR